MSAVCDVPFVDERMMDVFGGMRDRVILCPFCSTVLPFSFDFDSIHRCDCGACYKVCSREMLEKGVRDIAGELWSEEEFEFVQRVPIDVCNVVVEKDFDTLLAIGQVNDASLVGRFCKYDHREQLSLVWVKRLI